MTPRIKALNSLFSVLVTTAILGAIFAIDPAKEYSWLGGFFHGAWTAGNWILSLFMDDHLIKATIHTSSYNIFWWIGFAILALTCFSNFIILLFGVNNKK